MCQTPLFFIKIPKDVYKRQEICSQLEVFVSHEYTGIGQHSSAWHSSVKRDVKGLEIFEKWLKDHQSLVPRNHNVMSLATGIIGDDRINCHRSEEVGTDLVLSLIHI